MLPVKNIRCSVATCHKRLSFIEKNTCVCNKCNMLYCTLHRLAEAHTCTYNYKLDINKELFINDNKCIREKYIKI